MMRVLIEYFENEKVKKKKTLSMNNEHGYIHIHMYKIHEFIE